MKKNAIFRLLLVIACLLSLSACGAEEPEDLPHKMPEMLDAAYRPEYLKLALDCDSVINGCALDDTIYLLSLHTAVLDDEGHYSGNAGTLSRISNDGAASPVFSTLDFLNDVNNQYQFTTPRSLQTGADGTLWMLLQQYQISIDWTESDIDYICQVDSQGNQLNAIDLTEIEKELEIDCPNGFALDGDGWFYFLSNGTVYALNSRMEFQFSLTTGFGSHDSNLLVRLSNGQMGCLTRESKGPGEDPVCELRLIDKKAQGWGAVYPLPEGSRAAYPGSGGYLFFINSNGHICGWSEERDVLEQMMDSDKAGTELMDLRYFAMDPDGTITAVTYSFEEEKAELITLTPVDPASLPEQTTLTLACLSCPSSLRSYVNNFNRSHLDCQIELVEYSSDPHMPLEGYDRMIVDITAGNVPDILCLDRLPAQKFGAKGLFENLWPYIESDPELGRDALMSHVLECAEQDGSLYYIFDSFQMRTAAAPAAVAGDRLGWTLEGMEAALTQMPEGCQAYSPAESKQRLLYELLNANMGQYVDWETGTCAFDRAGFQQLLSYINSLDISPDSRGYEIEFMESTILDGRQMLYYASSGGLVNNFYAVQRCEAVLGGPVSFCGDPTQDGSCGSTFYIGYNSCPLAMTGACKDKEAAWSFLRTLLLPQDVDCSAGSLLSKFAFPINREDFELLARAYREAEDPVRRSFGDREGETVLTMEYAAVSAEEYGQIMELYDAIDSIYSADEDIWEIVSMEAAAYFAGERSLEDVAERIQSRAQLYINEQR